MLDKQTRELKGFFGFISRKILARLDFVTGLCTGVGNSIDEMSSILTPLVALLGETHKLLMGMERPFEQRFILEDATGKSWTIYMTNIPDWESLDFFLQKRFKGKKGARRVLRRRFVLQERASQIEIDRAVDWEAVFTSRQLVDMSLFCRDPTDHIMMASSCPWCKTVSSSSAEMEVQW